MQTQLRRFAVAMTVILALTFLLVGSSLAAARANRTLTGVGGETVQWSTKEGKLFLKKANFILETS